MTYQHTHAYVAAACSSLHTHKHTTVYLAYADVPRHNEDVSKLRNIKLLANNELRCANASAFRSKVLECYSI